MDSERRLARIAPREFRDFEVQLDLDGVTLAGKLGNISEDGLYFLTEDDLLSDELNNTIIGSILSTKEKGAKPVFFEGKIMWTQSTVIRGISYYAAGIQFNGKLILTDTMLARSLEI